MTEAHYRQLIGELVIENYALRQALGVYESALAQSGELLNENLAANAGLEPAARPVNEDVVTRVLTEIYRGHDG
jgi:hypothetical protein